MFFCSSHEVTHLMLKNNLRIIKENKTRKKLRVLKLSDKIG